MAHAYETFATGGQLTYRQPVPGPERQDAARARAGRHRAHRPACDGKKAKIVETADGDRMINKRDQHARDRRAGVACQVSQLLQTVVKDGTATRAQIPGVMVAGKTGTTENYGDAWFVGWTKEYTVAVWVGYPDEFKPMETEFQGEPVAGGTFPAAIWKSFMMSLLKIDPLPKNDGGDGRAKDLDAEPDAGPATATAAPPPTATTAPPTATTAPPAHRRRRPRHRAAEDTSRRRTTARAARTPRRAAGPTPPAPTRAPQTPGDGEARRPDRTPPGRDARRRGRHAGYCAATRKARRPGTRDVAGAEGAEPPRQLGGLGDPDPRARDVLQRLAGADRDRAVDQRRVVLGQLDAHRLGELARAVAGSPRAAARAHLLEALQRLQRADQHGGADALGLTHGVQQRVDAVGAIHVRRAGRAVQHEVRGVRPT